MLVLVAAAWVLWIAGWLRRVELKAMLGDTVAALGLRYGYEGWGPAVSATGTVDGARVDVRWRLGLDGRVRTRVRRAGGRWREIAAEELGEAVAGRL